MRRLLAFAVLAIPALVGCAASGRIADDDAAPPDDASPGDVTVLPLDGAADAPPADAAVADATPDAFAACADAALGGIGMPAGATATATTSYTNNPPGDAIDGDFATYWNSGDFTGSLTIAFASPVTFDGVRLYASSLPTTSETYTLYGIQNGSPSQIAQSTQTVQQGGAALATIPVPNDAYDGLLVVVDGNQSWVAINEIALVTTQCP
jgi:hypothetical protein